MNKRMVTIVLAALLLAVGVIAALAAIADKDATTLVETQIVQTPLDEQTESADEAQTLFELAGAIIEVGEGYFVMQDAAMGDVQVNFSDDSLFEGIEAEELAVGQVVLVLYDGKLTRSLPPQAYALRVGMYAVDGEVTAVGEDSITLVREEIGDEVIVFLPENAPELAVGDQVTVYTNGAMTMSLPAQTSALGVTIR